MHLNASAAVTADRYWLKFGPLPWKVIILQSHKGTIKRSQSKRIPKSMGGQHSRALFMRVSRLQWFSEEYYIIQTHVLTCEMAHDLQCTAEAKQSHFHWKH